MKKFEDTCKLLIKHGYRPISMNGPTKRIFIDDQTNISITVEFDKDKMTPADEELVKQRLIELGYL
jgi:hypothetical protein